MKSSQAFTLTLCLFSIGYATLASMDAELAKLEGELEKLELEKAKRELTNDIRHFLHPKSDETKKSLTETLNAIEAGKTKEKKSTSNNAEEITEASLDDIVREYKEETAKRNAEASLRKSLEQILENDLKKRSSMPVAKVCQDKRKDCAILKKTKTCGGKYKDIMKQYCEKTCEFCDVCVNLIEESKCSFYRKLGMCRIMKNRMERLCFKACGFCKMPAPPPCAKTTLGCCWDKTTTKIDKAGSNCPECKDAYKYVCKTFQDDCLKGNKAGIFMRKHCPKRCNYCNGGVGCIDQPEQAAFCPIWKNQGLCESDKAAMTLFCKKSCNLC